MVRVVAKITVLSLWLGAGIAGAQAPQIIKGKVLAFTDSLVTVATASGTTKIALAPDWSMSISTPITIQQIQPGSKIGTTNIDVPGGGHATEVHVFPPTAHGFEGQRTMDSKTGSRMTNGTVGKVVSSANGRELDVSFPGGTRHVQVPADALITSVTPADRTLLKPGISVSIAAFQEPGKPPLGRFVSTGPNGAPPAR